PAPGSRTLARCLACGGERLAPLPLAYEWEGVRYPAAGCRDCGMRFLAVQPAGETLARLDAPAYFARDFRCGRAAAGADDAAAFRAENDGLLAAFEPYRGRGRLLEVGCAAGLLLQRAAARGWSATGVEPAAAAAAHARGLGLDVHPGTLEAARLPDAAFDLVYMGDVLEHVPDCRATLAEVARVLAPGGHLHLRGPITTHSLARGLALAVWRATGRTRVLHEPPYHLWEFRPRPLARLAAAVGLEVVAMRQAKIPPGRPHGGKRAAEALAMAALDALNLPLTAAFNARGDRVVMVARKPPSPAPAAP
ncbi:MAG TPA: class I SAM-dependent methyltransferase, partial [Candidatus Eisenbacteria bacterium]|nr:class I SAM-dependent methyltransferase [Candidatus Eisenbacteria bacterium]